jgi:hypothetical protein
MFGTKPDRLKLPRSLPPQTFNIGPDYETPLIRHVTRARLDCATANGCFTLFRHYAARRRVLSHPARMQADQLIYIGEPVSSFVV